MGRKMRGLAVLREAARGVVAVRGAGSCSKIERLESRTMLSTCDGTEQEGSVMMATLSEAIVAPQMSAPVAATSTSGCGEKFTGGFDFYSSKATATGTLDGHSYQPGQEPRHALRLAEGLVPVHSIQWSVAAPWSDPLGGGGGSGVPQPSDVSVLIESGKHSTGLLERATGGKHIPVVELVSRDARGRIYAEWKLEDVAVTAFQPYDSAGDRAGGTEVIELNFAKLTHRYIADPNTTNAKSAEVRWDRTEQSVSDGALPKQTFPLGAAPAYVLAIGDTELEVSSWSWGASNPAGSTSTTAGKASATDLNVSIPKGLASPGLLGAAVRGTVFDEARLIGRDASGKTLVEWELADVRVSAYSTADGIDAASATDHVSLNSAGVTQTVWSETQARTAGYDFVTQQSITGNTEIAGRALDASWMPELTVSFGGNGELEVQNFSWGVATSGIDPTRGGSTGKAVLADASLQLPMGTDSPGMLLAVATAKHYPSVVLTRRDGEGREVLRWKLEDVVITSYSTGATAGSGIPGVGISLDFRKITQTVTSYAGGKAGPTVATSSYDLREGSGTGGTTALPQIPAGQEPAHMLELEMPSGGTAQVPLLAWSWGETRSGSLSGSTGTAKVSMADFQLQASMGLASPALMLAAATGRQIDEARIVSRDELGRIVSAWALRDALVSAYQTGGSPRSAEMPEGIALAFRAIELTTHEYGLKHVQRTAGWNQALNAKTGGTTDINGPLLPANPPAEHTLEVDGSNPIALTSLSWGESIPVAFDAGTSTGGTTGRVSMSDVTVRFARGMDSPGWLLATASGRHYDQVVLSSRGEKGEVYMRWRLEDVIVTSYQSADGGEESVSLNFGKITQEYIEQTSSGGKPVIGSWNVVAPTSTAVAATAEGEADSSGSLAAATTAAAVASTPEHLLDTGEHEIELLGWSWGVQRATDGTSPSQSSFSVQTRMGAHSVPLAMGLPRGKHYQQFRLESRDAEGRLYATWILSDVVLTDYSMSDAEDGAVATEEFGFLAERVELEYADLCPTVTTTHVQGTSGDDMIVVRRKDDQVEIFVNAMLDGTPTATFAAPSVEALLIDGLDGDDSVTLDFAGGDPLPAGATTVRGGNGHDTLVVAGTAASAELSFGDTTATVGAAAVAHEGVEAVGIGARAAQSLTVRGSMKAAFRFGASVFRTGSLQVGPGAQLDVGDNDLIVEGGDAGAIEDLVRSGRNGGADGRWSGAGITSSAAKANALRTVAVMVNPGLATFGGEAVDGDDVLIKHTWNGDANLDGRANADDYFRIDSGFLAQPANLGYREGDFNYDDRINADDYFLIDSAFLGQGEALAGGSPAVSAVVESAKRRPASLFARDGGEVRQTRSGGRRG